MNSKLMDKIECPHNLQIKKKNLSQKLVTFMEKFQRKIDHIKNGQNILNPTKIKREISSYNNIFNSLEDQFVGLERKISIVKNDYLNEYSDE